MPMYEFQCKKCENVWCEITSYDESGKYPTIRCPECKSKRKDKLLSAANFKFAEPVGTDRFNNSHDFRHNWNMDRPGGVRDQKKKAQDASHVGPEPYRKIDDISSGKHFGEVK